MLAMIRLCRPYYAAPMALTYTLTLYYAAGGEMTGLWPAAVATTVALMLVIAAAYALNDSFDVTVDRVNAPHRPVAAGQVSPRDAAVAAAVLLVAGLALGLVAGRWAFGVTLTSVAAGLVLYDATSKRLGAGKPVAVALLMTSIYPLAVAQAGGAFGPRARSLWAFAGWMLLTSFGYEVLKDIRDAPGDGDVAGRPALMARHPRSWRAAANVAILIGAALLIAPVGAGCKWVYAVIAPAAVAAAAIATALPTRDAVRAVYIECVIVGIAAAADVLILGM